MPGYSGGVEVATFGDATYSLLTTNPADAGYPYVVFDADGAELLAGNAQYDGDHGEATQLLASGAIVAVRESWPTETVPATHRSALTGELLTDDPFTADEFGDEISGSTAQLSYVRSADGTEQLIATRDGRQLWTRPTTNDIWSGMESGDNFSVCTNGLVVLDIETGADVGPPAATTCPRDMYQVGSHLLVQDLDDGLVSYSRQLCFKSHAPTPSTQGRRSGSRNRAS